MAAIASSAGLGVRRRTVIHVITVTVFAGYVADGRAVYWWRIAEWGS